MTAYAYDPVHNVYVPIEKEKRKKQDETDDDHGYIPRIDNQPHPPILTGENKDRVVFPAQPFAQQLPIHYTAPIQPVTYTQPQQYQYGYPSGYPYANYQPYIYNSTVSPAGTQVYYPQQTHVHSEAPKKDKKNKKKSKSKKTAKDAHDHTWTGRTGQEVYDDEVKMAGKEGVYASRAIAPRDPKPGDMFWVIPCEAAERPRLTSYYEIMDMHKPGKWELGPDGYLRWHKEEAGDENSSEDEEPVWEAN